MSLALGLSLIMTIIFEFGFVMTCSIIASFMVILPLDYWIGSTLKYIIINIIRRMTVKGFNLVTVRPPFEANGITFYYIFIPYCSLLESNYTLFKFYCLLNITFNYQYRK